MTPHRAALFLRLLLLAGFLVAPLAQADTPTITRVRGRSILVQVPPGYERVTLQQRTGVRVQSWRSLASKPVAEAGGTVAFVTKTPPAPRSLRVVGKARAAASEESVAGQNVFLADPALAEAGSFLDAGGFTLALAGNVTGSAATAAPPIREVAESDIWRVAGDRLYFFNQLRGLQVFDIANPDDPALLGQLRAPDRGEEMYLLDSAHVALLTRGSNYLSIYDSTAYFARLRAGEDYRTLPPEIIDWGAGAVVIADVSGDKPREVGRVRYRGVLRESRLVGRALYVVSDVSQWDQNGLEVTSFDLSDPAKPVKRQTLFLGGYSGVVSATDRFLFVVSAASDWRHSLIDVIHISSPDGALRRRGRLETAGTVNDKFKMQLTGDVLTAVSAVPRQWTGDWNAPSNASRTKVESFSLANPNAPVRLGTLEIGVGETVRATRFTDGRLYVVTFFQIDPLWVIDLANPAQPKLLGELEVPGFSTYIEPLGDRLVAVGRLGPQTAVSLFDISDPAQPKVLSQLPLGESASSSEANWDERAFSVIPEENLILVPYSGYEPGSGYASKVQILDLEHDKLAKRGVIDHGLAARRTAVVGDRILAISSSHLVTVDFADRDHPKVTSDVEIAWRVERLFLAGEYLLQLGGSVDWRAAAPQTVTVSAAANPDQALGTFDLDGATVVGATVRDGLLYVAQQTPGSYYGPSVVIMQPDGSAIATTDLVWRVNPFLLSIFDLAKLPQVQRLSRTAFNAEIATGYGVQDLAAVWPSPDLLVWVRPQASFYFTTWDFPVLITTGSLPLTMGGATSTLAANTSFFAPISFRSTGVAGVEAVAIDVRKPAAPALAAKLDIRTGSTGDWSAPFALDGKLYVSFLAYDDPAATADRTPTQPSRQHRQFLKVVDFTKPTQPVIGAEVNIPGKLLDVSRSGKLLLTVGPGYDASARTKKGRVFHTSRFNGRSAHLVDQLETPSPHDPYAVDGGTLLLGSWPAPSNEKISRIAAWRVDDDGEFTLGSSLAAPYSASLAAVHGLLVSDWGKFPHLYDVSDPAKIVDLGEHVIEGWTATDLRRADGAPGRGLWQPLGDSGVGFIDLAE